MIVGGPNKRGGFTFLVYAADNTLFATIDGADHAETQRRAHDVQREALAPVMGGYRLTAADWNDPLLDMTDDELRAALES